MVSAVNYARLVSCTARFVDNTKISDGVDASAAGVAQGRGRAVVTACGAAPSSASLFCLLHMQLWRRLTILYACMLGTCLTVHAV